MVWLNVAKGIITWLWAHKNIAAYIVMAVIIAFLTWRNKNLKIANQTMTIERGQLPDNIEFIAELKGTKFKITYRDSKNNIVHKEYYVPKEGGLTFTKYVDLKKYDPNSGFSDKTASAPRPPVLTNPISNFINNVFGPKKEEGSNINVKWYGFTFRPGFSAIYDGGLVSKRPITVALDAKLFYISRYSSGLGSSLEYPYVFASRHIDDIIPFIPVENLEIQVIYGRPYEDFSGSVFGLGGRTNF
jgi:hypothetical protein